MTISKEDAETLALRAPPRPVTRLNRRTIAIGTGSLAALVLGATLWSLRSSPVTNHEAPNELHNVDRVAHAEGLEQLPADYSKLPSSPLSAPPPVLGPALPGDLGGPILRAERQAANVDPLTSPAPLRTDPAADAARLARIDRQREMEEAAKAGLFFRGSAHGQVPASSSTPGVLRNDAGESAATSHATVTDPPAAVAQDPKTAFVRSGVDASTANNHTLKQASSPYEVLAGTVIPAALITGINSDLPGQVLATVTQGVYDSATGRHLLIPQGSRLLGQYDSQITFGQRRLLLVWNRVLFPDASSIALDRVPGVDVAGYAGLADGVDWHWRQILASAALATIVGVAAELAAPDRGNGQSQVIIATRQSVQDSVNQSGQEITRRQISVPPTLTVRPGFPVSVFVNQDLLLRPYQPLFIERSMP